MRRCSVRGASLNTSNDHTTLVKYIELTQTITNRCMLINTYFTLTNDVIFVHKQWSNEISGSTLVHYTERWNHLKPFSHFFQVN